MKHKVYIGKWLFQKVFSSICSSSFWINKYIKNDNLTIVQIGSNDGVMEDPLFKLINKNNNWKVLFVEPVPYLFEKLKHNHKNDPRFIFENVAINDGSVQVFYSVKEEAKHKIPNLPTWSQGLGSFYKENITKHLNGILEPYIVKTPVKGMTLQELFNKNEIKSFDLLHIDTEGYDWKILGQLDLKQYNPTMILFEHSHLSQLEKLKSLIFLNENYHIFILGFDCLGIRKDKFKKKDLYFLKKIFLEM